MEIYRAQSRAGDLAEALVLAAVCLAVGAGSVADAIQHGAAPPDWALGLALAMFGGFFAYRRYTRKCTEIRLRDDGSCEFLAPRRTVRLHVHEIRSVKCRVDDETGREEKYTIRYRGGRLVASVAISDFHGFVGRLKELNPAVDLIGFPAESPRRRADEDDAGRSRDHLLRTFFFPGIVVALIVWLAIQTMSHS